MTTITVTPTEERTRLQVHTCNDIARAQRVVTRWLERAARKQKRHINEPSVRVVVEADPSLRQTFLYGAADSFPDNLPEWLRTVRIT